MDSFPGNPSENSLSSGVTEAAIRAAVKKSGYPLQTVVSQMLRSRFQVSEEWSYIDRDTGDLRAIDILAQMRLYEFESEMRIRPQLDLLVECKQSDLPFAFFLSSGRPWRVDFPVIAGLRADKVTVTSDDDPSSMTFGVLDALEVSDDVFFTVPQYCTTFSKCVRKGTDLQLSGTDAYSGLVLPIIKAQQHFVASQKPVETAVYFDMHLSFAIGVVDAPLIAVECVREDPDLKLIPWVRILRHEYISNNEHWDRSKIWAIDVVHKDYFSVYLNDYLLPFADRLAKLALRHQQVLASGRGFVAGMGKNWATKIESRLSPASVSTISARVWAALRAPFQRSQKP
jgi:hypothetical protein